MTHFIPRRALLAAAFALLFTACTAPPPPPPRFGQVPASAGETLLQSTQSAHIVDKSIRKKITAQSVHARRLQHGEAEITARLVNLTDYPQQVEARAQFFDAHGIQAEPPSAWQRLHIPPRGTASYQTTSTAGNTVAHYQLEFRGGQ